MHVDQFNKDSYYNKGIVTCDREELKRIYINFFKIQWGINITQSEIVNAESHNENDSDGQICTFLDYYEIENESYQYALYGSEYILGLFNNIYKVGVGNLRKKLKEINKPLVFKLKVPTKLLDDFQVIKIVKKIIYKNTNLYDFDCCITFFNNISPLYIVDEIEPNLDNIEDFIEMYN